MHFVLSVGHYLQLVGTHGSQRPIGFKPFPVLQASQVPQNPVQYLQLGVEQAKQPPTKLSPWPAGQTVLIFIINIYTMRSMHAFVRRNALIYDQR